MSVKDQKKLKENLTNLAKELNEKEENDRKSKQSSKPIKGLRWFN